MDSTVNGGLPLEDQRRILSAAEQAGPFQLVKFQKGDPKPTNFASFNDAPLGTDIPDLVLVEITAKDSLDDIVNRQLAQGRKLICCNPAYVSGADSKVAVFR